MKRALDLCCGAGGASMGLHRAGFDVTGVDLAPQPRYPFRFLLTDALQLSLDFLRRFDFIWASWPCQAFSRTRVLHGLAQRHKYPDLITPGRALLQQAGLPYIMENVPGAPLHNAIRLCGAQFGLRLIRHRIFESNYLLLAPPHLPHKGRANVVGYRPCPTDAYVTVAGHFADLGQASAAMGIDWMTRGELAQAIPPAYSEYLARQLTARGVSV